MQPKPLIGFVLAKEKKTQDFIDLGFEVPESFGSNERNAALCEIVAIGQPTFGTAGNELPVPKVEGGDIVAYAPFSDMRIRIGTEEWLFIEFKNLMGNFGPVKLKKEEDAKNV